MNHFASEMNMVNKARDSKLVKERTKHKPH